MKCPVCGSGKRQRIYRLCDNLRVLGKHFPAEPTYLVSCEICGMVYVETSATQGDFLEYYKNGAVAPKYYEMFGKEPTEAYYRHILDVLEKYITPDSEILDIAGAWGELGKYLQDHAYKAVTNIDPNAECVEESLKKGIHTIMCSSSDMEQKLDGKYDLIILNHSLEHILDVETLMKGIDHILSDNGHVFIEVPDAEAYVKEDVAPYNFLTYEHILHFSNNDIKNLAVRYGYEVLELKKYYKEVSSYPSIYAVIRKGNSQKRIIKYSATSRKSIERYIQKSRKLIDDFIKPLEKSREKVNLWGIGASTTILLEAFKDCNVVSLIDRSPNRQGLIFHIGDKELRVEEPDNHLQGTIVILSIPYAESIQNQIVKMGIDNTIVTLRNLPKEQVPNG